MIKIILRFVFNLKILFFQISHVCELKNCPKTTWILFFCKHLNRFFKIIISKSAKIKFKIVRTICSEQIFVLKLILDHPNCMNGLNQMIKKFTSNLIKKLETKSNND